MWMWIEAISKQGLKVDTSRKKGKHGTPTDISQILVESKQGLKVDTSRKKGKHGTPTDISQILVEATASHVYMQVRYIQ